MELRKEYILFISEKHQNFVRKASDFFVSEFHSITIRISFDSYTILNQNLTRIQHQNRIRFLSEFYQILVRIGHQICTRIPYQNRIRFLSEFFQIRIRF